MLKNQLKFSHINILRYNNGTFLQWKQPENWQIETQSRTTTKSVNQISIKLSKTDICLLSTTTIKTVLQQPKNNSPNRNKNNCNTLTYKPKTVRLTTTTATTTSKDLPDRQVHWRGKNDSLIKKVKWGVRA